MVISIVPPQQIAIKPLDDDTTYRILKARAVHKPKLGNQIDQMIKEHQLLQAFDMGSFEDIPSLYSFIRRCIEQRSLVERIRKGLASGNDNLEPLMFRFVPLCIRTTVKLDLVKGSSRIVAERWFPNMNLVPLLSFCERVVALKRAPGEPWLNAEELQFVHDFLHYLFLTEHTEDKKIKGAGPSFYELFHLLVTHSILTLSEESFRADQAMYSSIGSILETLAYYISSIAIYLIKPEHEMFPVALECYRSLNRMTQGDFEHQFISALSSVGCSFIVSGTPGMSIANYIEAASVIPELRDNAAIWLDALESETRLFILSSDRVNSEDINLAAEVSSDINIDNISKLLPRIMPLPNSAMYRFSQPGALQYKDRSFQEAVVKRITSDVYQVTFVFSDPLSQDLLFNEKYRINHLPITMLQFYLVSSEEFQGVQIVPCLMSDVELDADTEDKLLIQLELVLDFAYTVSASIAARESNPGYPEAKDNRFGKVSKGQSMQIPRNDNPKTQIPATNNQTLSKVLKVARERSTHIKYAAGEIRHIRSSIQDREMRDRVLSKILAYNKSAAGRHKFLTAYNHIHTIHLTKDLRIVAVRDWESNVLYYVGILTHDEIEALKREGGNINLPARAQREA